MSSIEVDFQMVSRRQILITYKNKVGATIAYAVLWLAIGCMIWSLIFYFPKVLRLAMEYTLGGSFLAGKAAIWQLISI